MTDWPEAVREYEDVRGNNSPPRIIVSGSLADAAIAALKEMQMDTIEVLNDCQAEMGRQCTRAEQAEAEVERLRWMLDEALHDEWLVECVWRGIFDEDEAVIAMKADLAARYEKERDGTA